MRITREQAEDMAEAHAQGFHTPPDGTPREGCPECEGRPLSSYPRDVRGTSGTEGRS
jgi:hypothetical protein